MIQKNIWHLIVGVTWRIKGLMQFYSFKPPLLSKPFLNYFNLQLFCKKYVALINILVVIDNFSFNKLMK